MDPNFFIIGAAKAGTTALYEYMDYHPDVFVCSPKEPHFFAFPGAPPDFTGPGDAESINKEVIWRQQDYYSLFEEAGPAEVRGDASTTYLYSEIAARQIAEAQPDAKIIAVLRQPADRAYSAYMYMRSRGVEPLDSFEAALEAEDGRVNAGWQHIWHYRRMGYYGKQLARYYDAFPAEQIRVYLFDDFRSDPHKVLSDLFSFLEVSRDYHPPATAPSPNVSGQPRSEAITGFLTRDNWLKRVLRPLVPVRVRRGLWRRISQMNLKRVKIAPAIRAALTEQYAEDLALVEQLTGLDVSPWLEQKD